MKEEKSKYHVHLNQFLTRAIANSIRRLIVMMARKKEYIVLTYWPEDKQATFMNMQNGISFQK